MPSADSVRPQPPDGLKISSDADLIRAVAEGTGEAVSELYDRYAGMLMALALRILGDPAAAEEVLQEVFVQVWNQAGRYDGRRSSVSTWLVLITRSRSIDRLRSRQVKQRALTAVRQERSDAHTSPAGVRYVLMNERRERLEEEMARLPAEQRQVLEMAFFGGMTQSEIAATQDIPLGTVKTRTLLAMKKLRQALKQEIEDLL